MDNYTNEELIEILESALDSAPMDGGEWRKRAIRLIKQLNGE